MNSLKKFTDTSIEVFSQTTKLLSNL